jgi:hypothetical protein
MGSNTYCIQKIFAKCYSCHGATNGAHWNGNFHLGMIDIFQIFSGIFFNGSINLAIWPCMASVILLYMEKKEAGFSFSGS